MDIFRKEIDSFHALAPLLLPELVSTDRLEGIDEYEDYAMLTYRLAKPLGITRVMDDMEDHMGLNILYYIRPFLDRRGEGRQCCAYATPAGPHPVRLHIHLAGDHAGMPQGRPARP